NATVANSLGQWVSSVATAVDPGETRVAPHPSRVRLRPPPSSFVTRHPSRGGVLVASQRRTALGPRVEEVLRESPLDLEHGVRAERDLVRELRLLACQRVDHAVERHDLMVGISD